MSANGIHTLALLAQTLHLHPFRAIYWEEKQMLLLADLHLGKAAHFRRAGIAVPVAVADANLDKLLSLITDFQPLRMLFLGDLFHSEYNPSWNDFAAIVRQLDYISFELVPGNHDILQLDQYRDAGLLVHPKVLTDPPFLFSHHPLPEVPDGAYHLYGHLHPGVRLRGNGRQKLHLPCFYFGPRHGILPAFGAFTGLAMIPVRESDRVFAISGDQVIAL